MRRPIIVTVTGLAGCVLLPSAGCQLAYLFAPEEKVPPQFKLSGGRIAVILDDDNARIDSPDSVRVKATLVDGVGQRLIENKAVKSATTYRDQLQLMRTESRYDQLEPQEIGRIFKAEQVVFLQVNHFSLQERPGDSVYRGQIEIDVRVVETQTGRTVWETRGQPVRQVTPLVTAYDMDQQPARIARELANNAAEKIAKLFYEWVKEKQFEYEGPS